MRAPSRFRRKALLAVAALLATSALVAPAAQGDSDTVCTFTISGVHDNVVVPEGGFCFVQFAQIKGNVTALPDSHLIIVFSEVGGNVIGDKADVVQVQFRNTIGGDIQIKEGGPNLISGHQEVLVCGATLTSGSIQVEKMTIAKGLVIDNSYCSAPNILHKGGVKVLENRIQPTAEPMRIGQQHLEQGDLQVYKNTGAVMKTVAQNNVVSGVIQCYENSMPFVGGPNTGRADPWMGPPHFGPNQCIGTATS